MDIIILTGMSGAGKSQAADFLEDMGYFCIDNIPPMLLPEMVRKFLKGQGGEGYGISKLAFVVDIRSNELLHGFEPAIRELESLGSPYRIVFLEASDQVLINRYRQTRRRHPLSDGIGLSQSMLQERSMLESLRSMATHIIDTSMMAIPALRDEIYNIISEDAGNKRVSVLLMSFGFKYGIPVDCDNMYDVRFLPNPFYEQELKMLSGKDAPIEEYLLGFPETKEFIDRQVDILVYTLPYYVREGKARLVVGIGCTGGRHRSVYIAEAFASRIADLGYNASVHHRDIEKDPRYLAASPNQTT